MKVEKKQCILTFLLLFVSILLFSVSATANETEDENRTIVTTGTLGRNGAEWILYDDGVVEVGGGTINTRFSPWHSHRGHSHREDIKTIVFTEPIIAGEQLVELFAFLHELTHIENASYIDTTNVTDMSQMFERTGRLVSVDVSNWNTGNVTDMSRMFLASGIETIDVSNWDTSSVTDMGAMFFGTRIRTLDVSNWDTSNAQRMRGMFEHAGRLNTLTIGENFRATERTSIPRIRPSDIYTGRWQNIGNGTAEEPDGEYILTSRQLMTHLTHENGADTFIWQRNPRFHTVQWGDTLSELAVRYETTVEKLVQLNNIENPDFILVGEILTLSVSD